MPTKEQREPTSDDKSLSQSRERLLGDSSRADEGERLPQHKAMSALYSGVLVPIFFRPACLNVRRNAADAQDVEAPPGQDATSAAGVSVVLTTAIMLGGSPVRMTSCGMASRQLTLLSSTR